MEDGEIKTHLKCREYLGQWIFNDFSFSRAFPHPHFDKPIPDQQEPQPRGNKSASGWDSFYIFLFSEDDFHNFNSITMLYPGSGL